MRRGTSSLRLTLRFLLTPLFVFGKPNCDNLAVLAHNKHCDPVPAVAMPEHWGMVENIAYFAVVFVSLWMIRRLGWFAARSA